MALGLYEVEEGFQVLCAENPDYLFDSFSFDKLFRDHLANHVDDLGRRPVRELIKPRTQAPVGLAVDRVFESENRSHFVLLFAGCGEGSAFVCDVAGVRFVRHEHCYRVTACSREKEERAYRLKLPISVFLVCMNPSLGGFSHGPRAGIIDPPGPRIDVHVRSIFKLEVGSVRNGANNEDPLVRLRHGGTAGEVDELAFGKTVSGGGRNNSGVGF
ncbi:MAG: DUF1638 domain-containing protein [Anaerolineales bacterium]|nr:DUF1638 domain-containing protein [Anaerolineales bacterium]